VAGNKKCLSKKHEFTSSSTRGLAALEEQECIAKIKEVENSREKKYKEYVYSFS
jgi:hypothetical protein